MINYINNSIYRIKTLAIKEFLTLWIDKRILLMLLLSPIAQLFIFSWTTSLEIKNSSIVIYDQDKSQYSNTLISRLNNKSFIKNIDFINSYTEMKNLIDDQKVTFGITIPQNFQKDIISNRGTEIQFILDGRKTNEAQITAGYIGSIVQNYLTEDLNQKSNLQLITRNWFNPNLEYKWFISIALTAILSMVTTLIITALSLAQEKEFGTFDQTIVSPLQPSEILIGKTLSAVLFGIVVTVIMLLSSHFFFGVPISSSPILIVAVTLLFLISISGIGLFISSICKTQQQAVLGVFAFMVPSLMISGFVSPIESMPLIMRIIGYINPVTYYILLMKGLFLKNISLYLVGKLCIPLVIIGIITSIFIVFFFKRRLD